MPTPTPPAAHPNDWTGLELASGRYAVTAKLGEGGMGAVYKARDRNIDANVVVKVPLRSMALDPEFSKRFKDEIRSLVKLAHPHIVKITDVGEFDALPFAVMQFLGGGSLEDRQFAGERGQAAVGGLRGWLGSIASALDFIHAQGYIHRDVKPGNILFDGQGFAFLGDFGVVKVMASSADAKSRNSMTGAGMLLGTPEYMAPELIMGEALDGRVDQYALAVTVYEMLCGRRPFEDDVKTKLMVLHTTRHAVAPTDVAPWVPEGLSKAVLKGLAKDPGDRYPNCAALAAAVVEAARDVEAVPVPAARRRFACASCGKTLSVESKKADAVIASGRQVPCPNCNQPIDFATAAPAPAPTPARGGTMQMPALTPARTLVETPGPRPARTVVELPGSGPTRTVVETPRPARTVIETPAPRAARTVVEPRAGLERDFAHSGLGALGGTETPVFTPGPEAGRAGLSPVKVWLPVGAGLALLIALGAFAWLRPVGTHAVPETPAAAPLVGAGPATPQARAGDAPPAEVAAGAPAPGAEAAAPEADPAADAAGRDPAKVAGDLVGQIARAATPPPAASPHDPNDPAFLPKPVQEPAAAVGPDPLLAAELERALKGAAKLPGIPLSEIKANPGQYVGQLLALERTYCVSRVGYHESGQLVNLPVVECDLALDQEAVDLVRRQGGSEGLLVEQRLAEHLVQLGRMHRVQSGLAEPGDWDTQPAIVTVTVVETTPAGGDRAFVCLAVGFEFFKTFEKSPKGILMHSQPVGPDGPLTVNPRANNEVWNYPGRLKYIYDQKKFMNNAQKKYSAAQRNSAFGAMMRQSEMELQRVRAVESEKVRALGRGIGIR